MITLEREDTCCEKCYHDIENGVVFAIFQCEDCPCHSPKEEVQEKPYYQIDHFHCWNQGKSPACGLPKEGHDICCLCAIPKRGKKPALQTTPSDSFYVRVGGPTMMLASSENGIISVDERNLIKYLDEIKEEARTLALQEAAGIVRGQKRECKYCDPAHPHGDCYSANGNEALEDAAREIEGLSSNN